MTAATAGGATSLTASVVVTTPGNPPVDGSVSFYDGETLLGTVPVALGVANLNVGALAAGSHLFRALYSSVGALSPSSATVLSDTTAPRAVGLSRYGFHHSPTRLALTFDTALDATAAQNVTNYRIVRRNGRPVPVTQAVYNASSQTVTLTPSRRLNLHRVYTLVVNGQRPNGLTGVTGIPLDGSGHGQPGTNFVTKITWKALGARGKGPAVTYVAGVMQQSSTSRFARLSRLAHVVARPRA